MAEIRRGFGGEAAGGERLPWLEPVEDEDDYPEGNGFGGLAIAGLGVLIGLAILVTAVILVRHWHASHADIGQVIRAPATPYKVRPANPGGLKVDGSGAVAERTGTGNDLDAPLDLAAIPEQPVAGPGSNGATAPSAGTTAQPAATAPIPPRPTGAAVAPVPTTAPPPLAATRPAAPPVAGKPVEKPASKTAETVAAAPAGNGTIQLGALGSEAKARAVWKSLSARFAYLAPLAVSITPVQVGDATLYRLRASGGDSRALCARLKIAGETCAVVN